MRKHRVKKRSRYRRMLRRNREETAYEFGISVGELRKLSERFREGRAWTEYQLKANTVLMSSSGAHLHPYESPYGL